VIGDFVARWRNADISAKACKVGSLTVAIGVGLES
jgi:hypothetical protein